MLYDLQPQALPFYRGGMIATSVDCEVITGERCSGKSYAAAAKVLRIIGREFSALVIGRTTEWAGKFLGSKFRECDPEFSSQKYDVTFRGRESAGDRGCGQRYAVCWIDETNLSPETWQALRDCCRHFLVTGSHFNGSLLPGRSMLWYFTQAKLHAHLAGIGEADAEAAIPSAPVNQFINSRRSK